ncbi:hypothetical protein BGZ63DRAFT_399694 [Mariannaea sp. PMI_226]|nr:hypothetical protein BGZ63DRAFT_399694 [Mariannaea sp. PMI_226]
MTIPSGRKLYRIGVDVGGTNTDAVLACRTALPIESEPVPSEHNITILASCKSQTTPDVTTGIQNAIREILTTAQVPRDAVISVNIGTTHFINAVVQADKTNLSRVAVLRLCGPFCREVPPFTGFPSPLRQVLEGYSAYLDGGLELDGRLIKHVRAEEVIAHADEIRKRNISTVIVVGVFSPLDTSDISQENYAKSILQQEIPGADIVCSRDIGRVGFIERENAAILNGSILKFARRTIQSFRQAISELGLGCPLYLTQNDGTIIDAEAAALAPIKTFSSGATNSLTGAIFLSGIHDKTSDIDLKTSQIIMVDIGGTTSDFAALSPSGLPRQSSATANVGGIRTAFSMPEVVSIGLGGGSLVQVDNMSAVAVGPISVGHRLHTEALCYGGATLTATDIIVAQGLHSGSFPQTKLDVAPEIILAASRQIAAKLERCIDTMKTSDADVILLLVGGGSIIQASELQNVKRCIRPPFFEVANAVGAAIAKVSGEVDRIVIPNGRLHNTIVSDLKAEAINLALQNGARPGSVEIMDLDVIPLQYATNNAVRVVTKSTGELDWKPVKMLTSTEIDGLTIDYIQDCRDEDKPTNHNGAHIPLNDLFNIDLETYCPEVSRATGEWFVSEIDLEFIGEGCGILGTGGGGSVYSALLHSRETLRMTASKGMRIVEAPTLPAGSSVAMIAFAGAPSVSNERLIGGDELALASQELSRFLGIAGYDAMMAAEIGGSNGMRTFAAAATMGIPIVDADTMGRAFPKVDMALPYVFGQANPAPAVLSDARGNVQVVARVEDSHRFETIIRSACVELGLYTALSLAPVSREIVEEYCCLGGLSLAWFMGRAICLARKRKEDIVQSLLSVIPGGRLLYTGKVVDVQREVKGGWTIGSATLEPFTDEDAKSDTIQTDPRQLVLTYQNEFFSAVLQDTSRASKVEVLCTTPDLITVIDSHSGTALATHELRYGLRVAVIAMPAHPLWMTEVGLKAGGPQAFGLDSPYQPFGSAWSKPPSIFSTYSK